MKRAYVLDGAKMGGRDQMHDLLASVLGLPDYYGRNLDALRDCLTEREPAVIAVENAELADRECLSGLSELMLDLIEEDAAWQFEVKAGGKEPEPAAAADEPVCTGDCDHCTISHPEGFAPVKVTAPEPEKTFFGKIRAFFKNGK